MVGAVASSHRDDDIESCRRNVQSHSRPHLAAGFFENNLLAWKRTELNRVPPFFRPVVVFHYFRHIVAALFEDHFGSLIEEAFDGLNFEATFVDPNGMIDASKILECGGF